MASTSNATNVADEVPDSSKFDLGHAFTADSAIRRATPRIHQYLADEECNGPSLPNVVDSSRACQIPEVEGWVSGGQVDTNAVPMELLKLAKQEENENSTADVPHSQAFARLLRRLSLELRRAPRRGFQLAYCSDPCDYLECLDEMLRDIAETRESLKACDVTFSSDAECVYVGRSIDIYVQCLLAAAAELHTYN